MKAPVLTFFNNKGGVGKTSLVYHVAYMLAEMGKRVLAVDLDPQANLTAAFLSEEAIENLWENPKSAKTIYQCVKPLGDVGDLSAPELRPCAENLFFLPGDVDLSFFEEDLSTEWPRSMSDNALYRPLRVLSAFWQVMQLGAKDKQADLILVDIGPNLGAINRSVLIATDFVVIPLGVDLFSLQGLKNLGPTLNSWKENWKKRLENWNNSRGSGEYPDFVLPEGKMQPLGYICQQYGIRRDRPVKSYEKWILRIPKVYREAVLFQDAPEDVAPQEDPCCLANLKHYRSLIPMAQEHRKPLFYLTSADGAIGSHAGAVQSAKKDFRDLATVILNRMEGT